MCREAALDFWVILQVFIDVVLLGFLFLFWIRWSRPQAEDQRLSKGLQLLQSKIAILEDLSDRTDHQVSQLVTILESKIKEIQHSIHESEVQVQKINQRTQKSLEVAKIFQDKIPHDEIIERRNTIKYVRAARMAHHGESVEKIMEELGLSRAEVELISKMNKENLVFSEEQLPDWAKDEDEISFHQTSGPAGINLNTVFKVPTQEMESLKRLGEAFKSACLPPTTASAAPSKSAAQPTQEGILTNVSGKLKNVQPYQFKKIDLNQNLF